MLDIEGFSKDEVRYHITLLADAGYVKSFETAVGAYIERLTWDGHEFLDLSRDQSIWKKGTMMLHDKGIGLTVDILKPFLLSLAKEKIKEKLGIQL